MMFSLGMFPLINKPSSITDVTATLINNIFTTSNELTNNITSGLLINDIGDHLPVFATCRYSGINRHVIIRSKLVRKIDKDSTESFKGDLLLVNWDSVMDETDVDKSHDKFIDIFTNLYDKNCPLKKINVSKGNIENKPGLQMV